jgi:hypothetical protein
LGDRAIGIAVVVWLNAGLLAATAYVPPDPFQWCRFRMLPDAPGSKV